MPKNRRTDVVEDLLALRKGAGLTAARLMRSGALVQALGGPETPAQTLRERLLAAIGSLDTERGAAALSAAYGAHLVTRGLPTLTARRVAYAAEIGRTPDTLLDWENEAITDVALRLLTNYYAGAPIDRQLPMPHGGLLQGELTVTSRYEEGVFVEQDQARTIISLVEGARGFQYNSNVPTALTVVAGATVETEYVNGGSVHILRFPRPLALGQPHRFSFRERVQTGYAEEPQVSGVDFAGQSFETPTLRYLQNVEFKGWAPTKIWAYKNLSRQQRPGSPSDSKDLQGQSSVSASFAHLYGGLHTGIGWDARDARDL